MSVSSISNWNLEVLDFYEREKPEKNLSSNGRTNGGTWTSDSNRQRDSRFHKKKIQGISRSRNPYYLPWGEVFISRGGSRGGARGPLIFRPKWGPKGLKKYFWRPATPPPPTPLSPYHSIWMIGLPLIWTSGSASDVKYDLRDQFRFLGNRPPAPPLS